MQCKELESVLESQGLGPLPPEARQHLAGCHSCQGFLADLNTIVVAAKSLPAEVEPPARVWISLRAQLEAEGLIKEPVAVPEVSSWLENFSFLWKPRSLATATVAMILLVTTFFVTRTRNGDSNNAAAPSAAQVSNSAQPAAPAPVVPKASAPQPASSQVKELAPSPSETASTTLTQAELDVPNMQLAGNSQVDASLRQNLRTLNEFIAECELHLRQNPQDELAREYLNAAYQQKADLLSTMMESGRSEH